MALLYYPSRNVINYSEENMTGTQKKIYDTIISLPNDKLQVVLDFMLYLRDKDEGSATEELMDNNILSEIADGIKQIRLGDYIYLSEIKRHV